MHLTEPPDGTPDDAARLEQRHRALDEDHRVCDAIAALPDGAVMHAWVTRFALLADPTRLTLLLCIHAAGEICVSDLAVAAGLKDTTTSQALRLLRAQGLVATRRAGRVVRYRLADETVHALLHEVVAEPARL
ncbi:ArsR/SmtB family transcription factor [Actinomycetospora straminea]|uniref:Metalloregulator ArsR/SmtB family transcription factor n=2 Tax=Actinomycetospora TaxID=402649 RepID=A0ABP9EHG5_9PSEU